MGVRCRLRSPFALTENSAHRQHLSCDLVEKYEDEKVSIPDAPARDVLRLLMESNKLSQNKLAKKVGIPQSTISEILAGTKQMTVNHMIKLAAIFGVGPAVFMPKRKG